MSMTIGKAGSLATIITLIFVALTFFNLKPTVEKQSVDSKSDTNIQGGNGSASSSDRKIETATINTKPLHASSEKKYLNNVITAKGIGIIDLNNKNIPQRIYLAKRAAQADAKRQLTEMIGTLVTSVTDVYNGQLSKDEIHTKVRGYLRLAKKTSERELGDGTVEVTMEAPINQ